MLKIFRSGILNKSINW